MSSTTRARPRRQPGPGSRVSRGQTASDGGARRGADRAPWPALLVAGVAVIAYGNTFQNPFLFDDLPHILRNPHLEKLWPLTGVLAGTTRPFVQLTLAVNHAVSGTEVWSYHALNLAIHAVAGLALFGVVRRTLHSPAVPERFRDVAGPLALAASLIWVVHPLQTESVTYLIQRSESLAGLFYLLALYAVIRSAASPHPRRWWTGAVLASALGMASKAVMATAPLVILLYDRTFLAGSFGRAWQERRALYAGLAATLALLPLCFANGPDEWRTSAGLGVAGVTPLRYAMTEPGVILHYLRLCVWPHPLCLDYAWPIARSAGAILPAALAVAALLIYGVWAAWRRSALGFLIVSFFLILSPTSSVIPVADAAFEHRLYLALAAVTVPIVLLGFDAIRLATRGAKPRILGATATAAVVAALGVLTVLRNRDYRSELAMWTDVVAHRPANPRAQTNLGLALIAADRRDAGFGHLDEALRVDPDYAPAHLGLGLQLSLMGRGEEAIPHVAAAVRLLPDNGEAHFLLGTLMFRRGQVDDAYMHLAQALRLEPGRPASHYNMGLVLETLGRWDEARDQYVEAVRLKPDYANAHCNLGVALAREGRIDEARRELETALALNPGHPEARRGLEALRGGSQP